MSRLQMGAPGTQGLSLFGGDPGAPPGSASASGLRQVRTLLPRSLYRARADLVRTEARGCGWVGCLGEFRNLY